MNILEYTEDAYQQHDAHDYAEGHILEFHLDWKTQAPVNTIKIQNALAFLQYAALTGDTTGQYLNLFTYVMDSAVYMDTYPDSALIHSPKKFAKFQQWFQTTCTDWLSSHGCSIIAIGNNTSKYILKIHCSPTIQSGLLVAPQGRSATDTVSKIKVMLLYRQPIHHDALCFTVGYRTNVSLMDEFTDGLWYAHHRLQTGDTSLSYKYSYISFPGNDAIIYAHPDDALITDPEFPSWFENIVTGWMEKHECSDCSNITISGPSPNYFSRISCEVN